MLSESLPDTSSSRNWQYSMLRIHIWYKSWINHLKSLELFRPWLTPKSSILHDGKHFIMLIKVLIIHTFKKMYEFDIIFCFIKDFLHLYNTFSLNERHLYYFFFCNINSFFYSLKSLEQTCVCYIWLKETCTVLAAVTVDYPFLTTLSSSSTVSNSDLTFDLVDCTNLLAVFTAWRN